MKSLSLKKSFTIFALISMVILAALTLGACGGPGVNNYITPGSNASFSSAPDVKYNNAAGFTLEYLGNNNYKAIGTLAEMDATQAKTWGNVQEGAKYCVLNIKMGKDSSALIGWRSVEDKDKAFTEEETNTQENKDNIKKISSSNETKNMILAITDGTNDRYPDMPIWRIQITPKDSEEVITYTVDFSNLLTAKA